MKHFFLFLLMLLAVNFSFAQQDSIHIIADEMPRFPGCEELQGDQVQKDSCAQSILLKYLRQTIRYPEEARSNGNEGTVVISFIIEKDGTTSNEIILQDIPGGCGIEALRVVKLMNQLGVRWKPAQVNNQVVRFKYNLPVKFKLEELPPYTIYGRDSVYMQPDSAITFKGGDDALVALMKTNLKYPKMWADSCKIGAFDFEIIVRPNNSVEIVSMLDYNNLGVDFQFEAISFILATRGKWNPAMFQGKSVTSTYSIRLVFKPVAALCAKHVADFDKALALAEAGLLLYDEDKKTEAFAKLDEAVSVFPDYSEFIYARGMLYINENQFDKACVDLKRVKELIQITWFEDLIPIICR